VTILDTLDDPPLFAPAFRPAASWAAWRVVLKALFALAPSAADLATFTRHTGRVTWPTTPAREAWLVVGRRGGKSRIAALVAVYCACFRDYRPQLAAGERATVMVIAADRKQARVVLRYIAGLLDGVPMLQALVERRTAEALHLTNRVTIEVHTASYRTTRGYSVVATIADEIAFWPHEDRAEPDTEILTAIRPAMATMPHSLLLAISSPYARQGALWDAYHTHFAQDGDPVLVWQAASPSMNPTLDPAVLAAAYAADATAAAAEYGAEFRRDIETYVSREVIEACVVPGRHEWPRLPRVGHVGFVDPAGGSGGDSFTLAIAHAESRGGRLVAVLDALREVRPPFSPEATTADLASLLRAYGCREVTGDRYAGEWPREQFRKHGISYRVAEHPKSDLYRDALPAFNAGLVELLDHPRLLAQLCGLERRTSRGGRDSIDHGPHAHDDVANAVCGVLAALLVHAPGSEGGPVPIHDETIRFDLAAWTQRPGTAASNSGQIDWGPLDAEDRARRARYGL
jgi:hypothetical protein